MSDEDLVVQPTLIVKKRRKARSPKEAQRIAQNLINEAATLTKGERRCRGRSKVRDAEGQPVMGEDGKFLRRPCENSPIKGGLVCHMHGGKAPQVKAMAEKRLLAMVEPSLIRLEMLIQQTDHPPTALGAVRTVLERAGSKTPIGPQAKDTGPQDTRPVINIGIAVGGIDHSKVKVDARALQAANSVDVEVIDNEDDE